MGEAMVDSARAAAATDTMRAARPTSPTTRSVNSIDFPVSSAIIRQGPHGAIIACANCRREFDGRGLRYCSKACERALTNAKTLRDDMGPLAAEPSARRKCESLRSQVAAMDRWEGGAEVPPFLLCQMRSEITRNSPGVGM